LPQPPNKSSYLDPLGFVFSSVGFVIAFSERLVTSGVLKNAFGLPQAVLFSSAFLYDFSLSRFLAFRSKYQLVKQGEFKNAINNNHGAYLLISLR
jgi:hypothetical protein